MGRDVSFGAILVGVFVDLGVSLGWRRQPTI